MGCCGCIGEIFLKIVVAICQLLKAGCAIAIVCIVALHLWHVDYTIDSTGATATVDCQLGKDYQSTNLCSYAYVVCAVSLAVSLAVAILLCCTCDLCGLGFLLEVILAACGTLWWLAAALVFSAQVKDANDQDGPSQDTETQRWRTSVVVLTWAAFALFAFTLLVFLGKMLSKICSCCGCCGGDDKK